MASTIKTSKISLLICSPLVNIKCKVFSEDEIFILKSLGQINGAWWRRIQLDTKSSTNPISSTDPSESTKTTKTVVLFFTGKGNLNARACKSAWLRLTQTGSKSGVGSSWIAGVWLRVLLILILSGHVVWVLRPREVFLLGMNGRPQVQCVWESESCERWNLELQSLQLKKSKFFVCFLFF